MPASKIEKATRGVHFALGRTLQDLAQEIRDQFKLNRVEQCNVVGGALVALGLEYLLRATIADETVIKEARRQILAEIKEAVSAWD